VAALVLQLARNALLAGQLNNRRQEQRLARHRVGLLDQLGEEIERVDGRADSHHHTALSAQQRHNDLAPDANRHKRPFLTSDKIRIDTAEALNKKKQSAL
jgi:hypothetical protein